MKEGKLQIKGIRLIGSRKATTITKAIFYSPVLLSTAG